MLCAAHAPISYVQRMAHHTLLIITYLIVRLLIHMLPLRPFKHMGTICHAPSLYRLTILINYGTCTEEIIIHVDIFSQSQTDVGNN
jgi:hypothetical protein